MDQFALLFETLVLALTVVSFAGLLGFIIRDGIADRKRAARSALGQNSLALVRSRPVEAKLPAASEWGPTSKAA